MGIDDTIATRENTTIFDPSMLTLNVEHPSDGSATFGESSKFIVGEQMDVSITVANDFAYELNFDYVFKECSTVPSDENGTVVETDIDGNAIAPFNIMMDSCPSTGINFLKRNQNNATSFKDFAMKAFKYPDY